MNTMTFETYPDMMIDYERNIENEHYDEQLRYFTVPDKWGNEWIEKWLQENGHDPDGGFENRYTWDDTYQMYEDAINAGVVISESVHMDSKGTAGDALTFMNWLLNMGYLESGDIIEDGDEIIKDMTKIKTVAPKFYHMLMCMCY